MNDIISRIWFNQFPVGKIVKVFLGDHIITN